MLKIVTYNVNSLRKRLHLIEKLISEYSPDVICLQEIKISNIEEFPFNFFNLLGYIYCYVRLSIGGQGGVATISKFEMKQENFLNFTEDKLSCARHLSLSFKYTDEKLYRLHNFYVPAGGSGADESDLSSDKFANKISYVSKMVEHFAEKNSNKEEYSIVVGDLNIAPGENDVFNHKQLLKVISHTPIEIDLFDNLLKMGRLTDVGRYFVNPQEKLYSWWSYRSKNWQINDRGRRLDHVLVSSELEMYLGSFEILKHFRSHEQPSDHCPVVVGFGKKIS